MSGVTTIEWTDHTFNPWWGCARVSPGCQHCYAESLAKRYGHDVWGKDGPRRFFGDKHWAEPVRWNAAAEKAGVLAKVFCASMADVFEEHPALAEQRKRLWDLIARTPWLIWQLLTKRPENIARMLPAVSWPNVWLGTTVEDQQRADERIPELLAVPQPVAVRFLSCEPLLGPVRLDPAWLSPPVLCSQPAAETVEARAALAEIARAASRLHAADTGTLVPAYVDWVIAGGESGHGARPMHPAWARTLRDECAAAGVPFLFKQWGQWRPAAPGEHAASILSSRGVLYDGTLTQPEPDPGDVLVPVVYGTKKRNGRDLDGRTHDEFPLPQVPS